jgi:hypothetical protein
VFLCPVPQPDEQGKWNDWHRSLAQVLEIAKTDWIRAIPDKGISGYSPMVAGGKIPEPTIKKLPISELLQLAFKERLIEDLEHPLIKRLQGMSL